MELPFLPLGRAAIDRDAALRKSPQAIQQLAADPGSRLLLLRDSEVRLIGDVAGPQLLLEPFDPEDIDVVFYLGRSTEDGIDFDGSVLPSGTAIFAAETTPDSNQASSANWHNLRRIPSALTDLDAGLYSSALALLNWHSTHKHCPGCGSPTNIIDGGWSRLCPACDKQVFPRTDPAIIVAVIDQDDRLLLGAQGAWEANRWSVLAGFVEAGESLNAAVEREIFEEAGLQVDHIEYLGSQPWPFPYSLMFGFQARLKSGEIRPDGDEIVRLRWFSRSELAAELSTLVLPGKLSIARALIEHWLGQPLDELVSHGS